MYAGVRNVMTQRPHILVFLADQQRADCVGYAGHPMLRTPNMDRLAAEGIRFDRCYTTSPLCVPARLAMTMGLYPHNSNFWQNGVTTPLDGDTYMTRLRASGYRTCTIGENHLFPNTNCDMYANEPSLNAIGFDHAEDMPAVWQIIGSRSRYTDYLESLGLLDPLRQYLRALEAKPDRVRRFTAEALPALRAEHHIDAYIARRVERYVGEYDSDQPSFTFVGFAGPHEPWDAPDEYVRDYDACKVPDAIAEKPSGDWLPERSRRYQRWAQYLAPIDPAARRRVAIRYLGKIGQVDDAIGCVLAAYERKGWLENTAVIFSSDHGEMLGDLGRLSKSVLYESAVRVPMVLRLPQRAHAGRRCAGFVETLDIHATILDLAGVDPWPHQDSRSLLPVATGQAERVRSDVLCEVHAHTMLRTEDWKIVVGRDGQTLQLFDMIQDSLEQVNLCGHPDYRTEELMMRSRLLERLLANTLRAGDIDPEFSGHSFPDSDETGRAR